MVHLIFLHPVCNFLCFICTVDCFILVMHKTWPSVNYFLSLGTVCLTYLNVQYYESYNYSYSIKARYGFKRQVFGEGG